MFTTKNTRGFTLIELLVVITIIGILATGGVATYTSQIQKARDTNRLTDVKAIQSGVEQIYQDKSEYPIATMGTTGNTFSGITAYVPKLPKDPKSGQACNKGTLTSATACDYLYNVKDDSNGINNGEYRLSTGFENLGNVTSKAATDGGSPTETNRLEFGLNLAASDKSTVCDRTPSSSTTPSTTGVVTGSTCAAVQSPTAALIIAGN